MSETDGLSTVSGPTPFDGLLLEAEIRRRLDREAKAIELVLLEKFEEIVSAINLLIDPAKLVIREPAGRDIPSDKLKRIRRLKKITRGTGLILDLAQDALRERINQLRQELGQPPKFSDEEL